MAARAVDGLLASSSKRYLSAMTEQSNFGFEILWNDGEFFLSRSAGAGAFCSVLILAAAVEQPGPTGIARLKNAYELRNELDRSWAARPLEFIPDHGKPLLLIEDHGGELLARVLGKPWELDQFLRVAIGIAAALRGLHQRGFVHKDIKPANVFVNTSTGEAWLSGFGLASRVPRERQAPGPPESIAGTLAYMAPEQTGRMNRSVDSRSDLYSLGVTFYEMVTGELPFMAADAMEWIHCHVARQAPSPGERVNLPPAVSGIVLKLLAKNAEDRYQTAAGVEADLRVCLEQWESTGCIEPFVLGIHDIPNRMLISEKLCGRAPDVDTGMPEYLDTSINTGAPLTCLLPAETQQTVQQPACADNLAAVAMLSRRTIEMPIQELNLTAVLKISRVLSGEIVLERLVEIVLRAAIEYGNAQRGLLILRREAEFRTQAEGTANGSSVTICLRDTPISSAELPETVVLYAARTQESVILENASAQGSFSTDEYIRRSHTRSILCLRLVRQGRLIALLFLENNLTVNAFTSGTLAVLEVLASAAAISLENSSLYREVQEREGKIRRLVDANIVGVLLTDVDGRILEANDAFLQMIRYTRDDLTSGRLRWTDLTPAEWQAVSERAVAQLRTSGACELFEKEYFRSDGTRVPVLVGLASIEGTGTQNVAFVLDLTERKRAEQARQEIEERVINAVPALVWSTSPDGAVDFLNQRWQEFTGLAAEEAWGWNWEAAVHPDDRSRFIAEWRAALENGQPMETEARVRRSDGEHRWFLIRNVPRHDELGKVLKRYGTWHPTRGRRFQR